MQWLVALTWLAAVPPARPVDLAWDAPPGCPDAAALRGRIDALAAAPAGDGPPLRVDGRVAPVPGVGWRLELRVDGPGSHDERVVEAARCETLANLAALLVAIARTPAVVDGLARRDDLDPDAPGDQSAPREPGPVPEPVVSAADPPPAPSVPRPAPPDPRSRGSLRAALRVGLTGELGAIPAWNPGLVFGAALLGPAWRAELLAGTVAGALRYPDAPDVGGRFTLWTAALRGCGVPRRGRLELPLCVGVELGDLRGRGEGVPEPVRARELWAALQLAPGVAWAPARWVALGVGLELLIALRRPAFHVDGRAPLVRAAAIGLRPVLAIELRFP